MPRRTRSFRSFYCFTKHSFRQFWPLAVFKDYFSCFRGLEKAGFSEKTSCGSKCLFADHRASRTSRTHDSSERRQHFISVPLTIDKRKHNAIHLSGQQWHFIQTGKVGNFRKHNERRLMNWIILWCLLTFIGSVQNVDPPFWTPLLDPICTPSGPAAGPRLDPYLDPHLDPDQDPYLDPLLDPNLDPHLDPNLNPNLDPLFFFKEMAKWQFWSRKKYKKLIIMLKKTKTTGWLEYELKLNAIRQYNIFPVSRLYDCTISSLHNYRWPILTWLLKWGWVFFRFFIIWCRIWYFRRPSLNNMTYLENKVCSCLQKPHFPLCRTLFSLIRQNCNTMCSRHVSLSFIIHVITNATLFPFTVSFR